MGLVLKWLRGVFYSIPNSQIFEINDSDSLNPALRVLGRCEKGIRIPALDFANARRMFDQDAGRVNVYCNENTSVN